MLHEDVRRARMLARLSQSELARRSGVPRKQVRALEAGGNVTLATLRKIAAALPTLEHVTLGGLEINTANVDLEGARQAAHDIADAARRLVAALEPGSSGATRHDSMASDLQRAAELEPLIDEIEREKSSNNS